MTFELVLNLGLSEEEVQEMIRVLQTAEESAFRNNLIKLLREYQRSAIRNSQITK